MKNVSDFKKRLKVGSMLHTIYHQEFAGRDGTGEVVYKDKDRGVRKVSKVGGTQFALLTVKLNGEEADSWCSFPKASVCKILDENTIQIFEEDNRVRDGVKPLIPILTYKFEK